MNFDPTFSYGENFPQEALSCETHSMLSLEKSVEDAIENTIIESIVMGSGGPENLEITDQGLRFVRHLLATTASTKHGFLPNLKNSQCIRALAQDYIRKNGNGPLALDAMYQLMYKVQH
jgi:hypothetical protein